MDTSSNFGKFAMYTYDRCLNNVNTRQVIPYGVSWIPKVSIMAEELLEDSDTLWIIDSSKRYSCYV